MEKAKPERIKFLVAMAGRLPHPDLAGLDLEGCMRALEPVIEKAGQMYYSSLGYKSKAEAARAAREALLTGERDSGMLIGDIFYRVDKAAVQEEKKYAR